VNKLASLRWVATGAAKFSPECFGQVVSIKLDMDDQKRARFAGPNIEIGGDTIVVVEPCAHMLERAGELRGIDPYVYSWHR